MHCPARRGDTMTVNSDALLGYLVRSIVRKTGSIRITGEVMGEPSAECATGERRCDLTIEAACEQLAYRLGISIHPRAEMPPLEEPWAKTCGR